MKRSLKLLGATLLVVASLAATGCGFKFGFHDGAGGPLMSTISGNPLAPKTTAAATALSAVCTLMQSCYGSQGVTQASCTTGISNENDDYVLGLPPGQYSSYQAMVIAESVGSIMANPGATKNCLSAIPAQTCAAIAGSYDSTLSDPYAHSDKAFPGACNGVFNSGKENESEKHDK